MPDTAGRSAPHGTARCQWTAGSRTTRDQTRASATPFDSNNAVTDAFALGCALDGAPRFAFPFPRAAPSNFRGPEVVSCCGPVRRTAVKNHRGRTPTRRTHVEAAAAETAITMLRTAQSRSRDHASGRTGSRSPRRPGTWWDEGRILLNMDEGRKRLKHIRNDPRVFAHRARHGNWYTHLMHHRPHRRDPRRQGHGRHRPTVRHYTARSTAAGPGFDVSAWVRIDRWHGWGTLKDNDQAGGSRNATDTEVAGTAPDTGPRRAARASPDRVLRAAGRQVHGRHMGYLCDLSISFPKTPLIRFDPSVTARRAAISRWFGDP